jgi:Cys-tRNA(Pro) deacylase
MNSRTPALEAVDASGVPHGVVRFEPAPDLATAAERRGIPVAQLLKTMVVRIAEGSYLLVLVPGDRVIDWKALRSHVGVRGLALADADEAFALTGYRRGTITPFGAQGGAPVVADTSIVGCGEVSVGGGEPGVAVHLDADDLIRVVVDEVAAITKPASG